MNKAAGARLPLVLFTILAAVTATVLVTVQRQPILERLEPAEANPGDVVAVVGRHLGGEGRISLDGLGIPADSVRTWRSNLVVFVVPDDRSSGNVVVQTESGRSAPLFLTIGTDVPRVVDGTVATARVDVPDDSSPFVSEPGRVLVVRGAGFGPPVGVSAITFRTDDDEKRISPGDPFLAAWSDKEIRVVVPDGSAWTSITVEPYGFRPAVVPLTPADNGVVRELGPAERFAVTFSATVEPSEGDALVLFPRPVVSSTQPEVQTLRPSEHEWFAGEHGGWRVQISPPVSEETGETAENVLERGEMISRRSVQIDADTDRLPGIGALSDPDFRSALSVYLGRDRGIDFSDRAVSRLVVENEISLIDSPADQLLAIADAVVTELAPSEGESQPPAYSYASFVVAAARRIGIPARRVSGILALDTGVGRRHFWGEGFVPGIGWVPIDAALAAGMHAAESGSTAAFYSETDALFLLDGNRVAFDKDGPPVPDTFPGVDDLQPVLPFTLQSQLVEVAFAQDVDVNWRQPEYLGRY